MLSEAIHSILNNVSENNFPDDLPQGFDSSNAYIIYLVEKTNPENSKSGQRHLDDTRIRVSSYSTSKKTADQLNIDIYNELSMFAGSQNGVNIQAIYFENEYDEFIQSTSDTQLGIHVRHSEYYLRINN